MNRSLFIIFGSALVLSTLLLALSSLGNRPGPVPPAPTVTSAAGKSAAPAVEPLLVYCAASNRAVMEAVKSDYEAEFGVPVNMQYGPSQTLLSNLQVSDTGDLFLPADDSYLAVAREKGVVEETIPVAEMQAVLAVRRDRALSLESLAQLLQSDFKIVQANPDAAAISKLARDALTPTGAWDRLAARTVAFKGTVNEVANDVQVGAADVGIVFDAVLHTMPELASVHVPELDSVRAQVSIGVASASRQPQRALHFARYLSAPEKGQRRYSEYGFRSVPGDPWADSPELSLFSGSMLRPAIEQTIIDFEQREGVRVNRVYNGCGILVAQMKAGQVPDAYFACDTEFMQQVHDLFPHPTDVSQNELVILVPKGNPRGIASLRDLTKPGLRVGIGHEKQCAMGWLTQKTLKEGNVQTEVMANVTVQTPTGDMLVNQMKAGSLDAAVAYISNAAGSGDVLDAVRIKNIPCAVATQPFAVAQTAKYPRLMERLLERLESAKSESLFLRNGFSWKAATKSDEVR